VSPSSLPTSSLTFAPIVLAVAAAIGWASAWWLHRRTALSARNLDVLAGAVIALAVGAVALAAWAAMIALAPCLVAAVVAAVCGRRYRLGALGAGGELREFEQGRQMVWQAFTSRERRERRARRVRGDRTWVAGQGELVTRRGWPADEPWLPMAGDGRGRIPRRAGRHLLIVGSTGSGKTVSARRWLLGRILADGVAVLATDPKGDSGIEQDLRAAARVVGRPFVLFDPCDPGTDRWNPLWSEDTGGVVSRLVAPIAAGEGNARYYADLLQIHLGLVAGGLRAAGLWPANMPLLLEAAQLHRYKQLLALVGARAGEHAEITERMRAHRALVEGPEGRRDLTGGTLRLRVVAGETWRTVLTGDPARGAVTLPAAMEAGAIVLLRTWVDDLPEEAKAITTLFLADAAAAALATPPGTEWAALIDEFGGVLSSGAGERALGLMQRARSGGGQVAVTTQSIADFAAATANPALLEAMADNFSGGIFHRQVAPDSKDWLARMIGTRELWQYTARTGGSGATTDGSGSRRRVHEFLMRPDEFRTFGVGEAVIWSALGPEPQRVTVTPAVLPDVNRDPVSTDLVYRPCGPATLPAATATAAHRTVEKVDPDDLDPDEPDGDELDPADLAREPVDEAPAVPQPGVRIL
jgi:hypothetical protein